MLTLVKQRFQFGELVFKGGRNVANFNFFTNIWASVTREGEMLQGFAVFHGTPMVLVNTSLQN